MRSETLQEQLRRDVRSNEHEYLLRLPTRVLDRHTRTYSSHDVVVLNAAVPFGNKPWWLFYVEKKRVFSMCLDDVREDDRPDSIRIELWPSSAYSWPRFLAIPRVLSDGSSSRSCDTERFASCFCSQLHPRWNGKHEWETRDEGKDLLVLERRKYPEGILRRSPLDRSKQSEKRGSRSREVFVQYEPLNLRSSVLQWDSRSFRHGRSSSKRLIRDTRYVRLCVSLRSFYVLLIARVLVRDHRMCSYPQAVIVWHKRHSTK